MIDLNSQMVVGGVLALAGALFCVYWYVYFKRNFDDNLLTEGPYKVVRHPLYSGFIFLAVGLAIALPIYETKLLIVITTAVMYVYVPKEEEQMMRQYKKKYAEYKKKTPWRLIPYIY